jgi:hypothetical protein
METTMLVANDPIVRVTTVTATPDLAELAHAVPARRPRRAAMSTWDELVEREPCLADLLEEIEAMPHDDPHFCGVQAWFGPKQRGGGLKDRMTRLVGWHAERDDSVLRSDVAYRVAYRPLYDALPPCEDCPCGVVARVLYGAERTP